MYYFCNSIRYDALINQTVNSKVMRRLFLVFVVIAPIFYFSFFIPEEKESTPVVPPKAVKVKLEKDPDSLQNPQYFPVIPENEYDRFFKERPSYANDGFDFPVGKPDAENYYKALNFGQRLHLGEDWNGKGGGNTDMGDPVYSTAHGLVVYADNICCGWGNTIRVVHYLPNHPKYKYVESIYSHLQNVYVKSGQMVLRGQHIGSIGNARGRYSAHLHFEMRDFVNMSIGPGYSEDQFGYLSPTDFINEHRP